MATGLLPLCFGEATKFSADLLNADKTYEAVVKFGITTDSGDAEGKVIATATVNVAENDIFRVLPQFTGAIQQIPPMHSALKRDGRPLYELARQGIVVEREARAVTIYSLEVLAFTGDTLNLRVSCSKGTYIRVLASDIGDALGCGGHLTALRRTEIADLNLTNSVSLAELEAQDESQRLERLQPVDALLLSLPKMMIEGEAAERFSHGNPIERPNELDGKIRVYADDRLIGVGEPGSDGRLWPKRLVQLAI
jgi:tRNA pseudouridine55 synthase